MSSVVGRARPPGAAGITFVAGLLSSVLTILFAELDQERERRVFFHAQGV